MQKTQKIHKQGINASRSSRRGRRESFKSLFRHQRVKKICRRHIFSIRSRQLCGRSFHLAAHGSGNSARRTCAPKGACSASRHCAVGCNPSGRKLDRLFASYFTYSFGSIRFPSCSTEKCRWGPTLASAAAVPTYPTISPAASCWPWLIGGLSCKLL